MTRFQPSHRPVSRGRTLALEPLEGRLLLTALVRPHGQEGSLDSPAAEISVFDQAAARGAVQVLKIRVEHDGSDSERDVAAGELPAAVAAAVLHRLPAARLLSAESGQEHGVQVYDVRAIVGGAKFDVAVSAEGRILEVEQNLGAHELPQAIQDWIDRNYPGAAVAEAVLRDDGSYEVVFLTTGRQAFEATLQVAAGESAAATLGRDSFELRVAAEEGSTAEETEQKHQKNSSHAAGGAQALAVELSAARNKQSDDADEAAQGAPAALTPASDGGDLAPAEPAEAPQLDTRRFEPASQVSAPSAISSALLAAFSQSVSELWLPRLADDLHALLPVDAAAVQQAFADFLHEVDGLAEEFLSHGGAWKLAPLVLVAGAEVWWTAKSLGDARRGCGALVAAGPESTWITA